MNVTSLYLLGYNTSRTRCQVKAFRTWHICQTNLIKTEMQVWTNISQGATFRIITEIKQKRGTVLMLKTIP